MRTTTSRSPRAHGAGGVEAGFPMGKKPAITEIASQQKELTDRARNGRLKPADVTGGTFTITNLGMYNVDPFNAIIAPPQAAILAVGRIADRVEIGRASCRERV